MLIATSTTDTQKTIFTNSENYKYARLSFCWLGTSLKSGNFGLYKVEELPATVKYTNGIPVEITWDLESVDLLNPTEGTPVEVKGSVEGLDKEFVVNVYVLPQSYALDNISSKNDGANSKNTMAYATKLKADVTVNVAGNTNRIYTATASNKSANGENTKSAEAKASVYSLVADAIDAVMPTEALTEPQLIAATAVLNNGGNYLKKSGDAWVLSEPYYRHRSASVR